MLYATLKKLVGYLFVFLKTSVSVMTRADISQMLDRLIHV